MKMSQTLRHAPRTERRRFLKCVTTAFLLGAAMLGAGPLAAPASAGFNFTNEVDYGAAGGTLKFNDALHKYWHPPGSPSWAWMTGDTVFISANNYGGPPHPVTGEWKTEGTLMVVCTWTPSYSGEIPPKTFRVSSSVFASVRSNPSWDPSASGNADNGLGAPTVVTNQTGSFNTVTYTSAGTGIYQAGDGTVVGNSRVWRLPISISAAAAGSRHPTNTNGDITFNIGGGVSNVQADTRSVKLSRPGAIGETSTIVNGNWVTSGDTTYSHAKPGNVNDWNYQTFQANIQSGGHAVTSWSWSPQAGTLTPGNQPTISADTVSSAVRYMPLHTYESALNVNPVQSYTLKVVFDDGVTASATYKLGIHTDYAGIATLSGNSHVNTRRHPFAIDATSPADGSTIVATVSQPYSWTATPEFFGSAEQIAAGRWVARGGNGFDPDLQQQNNAPANLVLSANNVDQGKTGFIQIYDKVNNWDGTAAHYSQAGYVGQTTFDFDYPNISDAWDKEIGWAN